MEQNWIRLPLENAQNVREMGGIPAGNGKPTRWKSFLRADDMNKLSDADIQTLHDYGVTTVIDLRSDFERLKQPNRLKGQNFIKYYEAPLSAEEASPEDLKFIKDFPSLGNFYVDILKDRVAEIKYIFEVIAGVAQGCILFHCAGGKDRTGVISLLLLLVAGARLSDIQTNYMISNILLMQHASLVDKEEDKRFAQLSETYGDLVLSPPEEIEVPYLYIQEQGGILDYLKDCGISQTVIDKVKKRIQY